MRRDCCLEVESESATKKLKSHNDNVCTLQPDKNFLLNKEQNSEFKLNAGGLGLICGSSFDMGMM